MYLLGEGRRAYLELLRNLTPQALIFAFAVIASDGLTMRCCDLSNTKQTSVSAGLFIAFLLGLWANSSLFLESYAGSFNRVDRAARLFRAKGIMGSRRARAEVQLLWRRHRARVLEAFVILVILEVGLLTVTLYATVSAVTFLKLRGA